MITAATLSGCAARYPFSEGGDIQEAFRAAAGRHNTVLSGFAALLRVKMEHDGRINDFRVELFSSGDSLLSVYVRGFLGKSVFKAVIREDSVHAYFPEEKSYFFGLRSDLETGELEKHRAVVHYVLDLFHGAVPKLDTNYWHEFLGEKRNTVRQTLTAHLDSGSMTIDYRHQGSFPYMRWELLEMGDREKRWRVHVRLQESAYNRQFPSAKFELRIPDGSRQLNNEEMVELLCGIS